MVTGDPGDPRRRPGRAVRRRALVVRGGWEGHQPVETTRLFLPVLTDAGFDIDIYDDLDVYADASVMASADLIVQCWTMGVLTPKQEAGLVDAVSAGTGFAGWHGGVVATFATSPAYLRMVGGQFLFHPREFVTYRVNVDCRDHPVLSGIDDFTVHTEQYWMLTDAWNDVLATTRLEPHTHRDLDAPLVMPVVWTRKWGRGNVFFSAIGHSTDDLTQPEVFTLTARGLVWASRLDEPGDRL